MQDHGRDQENCHGEAACCEEDCDRSFCSAERSIWTGDGCTASLDLCFGFFLGVINVLEEAVQKTCQPREMPMQVVGSFSHNPKTGDAEDDLKHAEKATDTSEAGTGPATTHFNGTGR